MNKLRTWIRTPRILVAVMVALLAASVGSVAVRPANTTVNAGISITADRNALGVTVGSIGVFAVTASQPGSVLGPISLAVSGAPRGTVVSVLPTPTLSGVPAVIAVVTSASTPVGTYALKVAATGSGGTATVTVQFSVTLATGFTMQLTPSLVEVIDGNKGTFNLAIQRGLLSGPINLTVSGLPQYATASVSPSLSLLGSSAKITVNVPTNVLPGLYEIKVTGKALLASAEATAMLRVLPETRPNFPVSGTPDRSLAPGAEAGRVNLSITNPNNTPMTVSNIAVSVLSTDTSAQPGGCAVANYESVPYTGPATLVVPANSTRTIGGPAPGGLGVPRDQWPGVRMINTAQNQDNCKGVSVQLRLNAKGDGQ